MTQITLNLQNVQTEKRYAVPSSNSMSTCFPSLTGVATRILIPRVAPTKGGPLKPFDIADTIEPLMLRPEEGHECEEWRTFARPSLNLGALTTESCRRCLAMSTSVLNPLIDEPKVQLLALIDQAIEILVLRCLGTAPHSCPQWLKRASGVFEQEKDAAKNMIAQIVWHGSKRQQHIRTVRQFHKPFQSKVSSWKIIP